MTVLELPTPAAELRPTPAKLRSTSTPATELVPAAYQFSLDQYLALSEQGWFSDRRVQYIDGEIIAMPAQYDDHAYSVTRSGRSLDKIFPEDRFWVRSQMTLLVGQTAPDPDVVVIVGAAKPGRNIPDAAQALLVIEVSDSTLLYDRTVKAGLYAAGGIAEYLIVNVVDRQLEVHRDPVPDPARRFGHRYDSVAVLKPGETFSPLAAPAAAIAVEDFM